MKSRRLGKSQGSLSGWLFADLTLILAIVTLSSWTINRAPTSSATVSLAKYQIALAEIGRLERQVSDLQSEIQKLREELQKLKNENEILKGQTSSNQVGVKLEPVVITISADPTDTASRVIQKIERELERVGVNPLQGFSFALIFGGTQENPTEQMRLDAKARAENVGNLLRGLESEEGWNKFTREKYVRSLHEIGLGVGFYKIELYPSN